MMEHPMATLQSCIILLGVACLLWTQTESIKYGRDGCCIRFGWFSAETVGDLQCPLYEHNYQLPENVEQVQWCLNIDDMLKLASNSNMQSYNFNESYSFNDTNHTQSSKYTLLTKDNFLACTKNSSQCGMLFMSCIMQDCVGKYNDTVGPYPNTTVYTTEEPTKGTISAQYPTEYPIKCNNTVDIEQTYVQYTPLSEPKHMKEQSVFDNRQSTLKLRFLFAENGADPWEIDIANGESPKSPFIGQIVITLTDETQQFDGWVECDGREYNVMMYPKLFDTIGYVFGANWNDDTFMIPDCTNRVLIHHSNEFIFGTVSGNDDIEITQNGILLPPHTTDYDTGFVDLNQIPSENLGFNYNSPNSENDENSNGLESSQDSTLVETEIKVTISENIVNYDNTVTEFNNMQQYLVLNFLIVTHGKLPFGSNDSTIYETTKDSYSDTNNNQNQNQNNVEVDPEHTGSDRKLYIGEIVIYSNHQIPPGFVACDGSYLHISEYSQLFQVFGFKYGGNDAIQQFKLPDCRGRALMHRTDPLTKTSLVGETGGEIISKMTTDSIPSHSHGQFNFISQSNVLAHVQTYESGYEHQCKPISNWMPYIAMNFAYYNGSNDNACKKSHFLGAIGIFAFNILPRDFSNDGLSHERYNRENNKLTNSNLKGVVSNDFVWSSECVILPNFESNLLAHSIDSHEFATVCGKNKIGCDILIPHQHITFITTTDTYCTTKSENITTYLPITDDDSDDSCKIGQWTPYSSCIFGESFNDSDDQITHGHQFRTRKLYIKNKESYETDTSSSETSETTNGVHNCPSQKCSGGGSMNKKLIEDCECDSPSREVQECSIENCLQIVMNGDRKSYFDNKWKLFDTRKNVVASGRDNGYGSEEGCIIVNKGECYKLHLYDRTGDGLCCEYGNGNIRWYFENELLGFYHNNDNWYEQVIDVCIPNYGQNTDHIGNGYDTSSSSSNDDCISVNITGDSDIESENFWNIYDGYGNTVMTSSKPHIVVSQDCQCKRLPLGCYDLVLFDESGDGICCKTGEGRLTVAKGNSLLVDYYPNKNDYFTFKKFHFCL